METGLEPHQARDIFAEQVGVPDIAPDHHGRLVVVRCMIELPSFLQGYVTFSRVADESSLI
jgi:hypothetical protein